MDDINDAAEDPAWSRNIERFAAEMADRFGDRACTVASREAAAARGAARKSWLALARLLC
jgi:hypothetical protein